MQTEKTLVSLDFERRDGDGAHISVFDRGFLYGDSVYEVVRTYAGRLFHLKRHFLRLDRSAQAWDSTCPSTRSA